MKRVDVYFKIELRITMKRIGVILEKGEELSRKRIEVYSETELIEGHT